MNGKTPDFVRFCIRGGEAPVIDNWDEVIADMRAHAVLPVAGFRDILKEVKMPPEVNAFWQRTLFRQMSEYAVMLKAQEELTRLLEDHGIKAVILKGFATVTYYPNPMFRGLGDIDFMVRGASPGRAKEILEQHGYSLSGSELQMGNPDSVRHYGLEKNGIEYELHSTFTRGETDADMRLEEILLSAETQDDRIGNTAFCRFSDPVNGLIILSHMRHHLQSTGIGLRQLLDWMYFAGKCLTDEMWNMRFLPLVRQTGLECLAVYATAACEKYLGLEKHAFSGDADPALTDALFNEIIESGNFGRNKSNEVTKVSSFLSSPDMFKRLQSRGQSSWKALEKHPRLKPFAWIYQSFQIAGMTVKNRKLISSVKAGKKLASERDALLKKLQIYRSNNTDPEGQHG